MIKTALNEKHIELGAKMVDYFGWHLPLHYGSQIQEHQNTRQNAGVFDVSHMTIIDIHGARAKEYLKFLLANDVTKLKQPGKALYSAMLNEQAGVIDDLVVYFMAQDYYRLVTNASTKEKVLTHIENSAKSYPLDIICQENLSILALQGPQSKNILEKVLAQNKFEIISSLKPFFGMQIGDLFVSTTGYTGEKGFEIMLSKEKTLETFSNLIKQGAFPVGLGARDTLRLEAGFNLYGQEMDENTSPLVANMKWTLDLTDKNRNFIGKQNLQNQLNENKQEQLIGLVLQEKGMLRNNQEFIVIDENNKEHICKITSGAFSPSLEKSIALAKIPNIKITKAKIKIRKDFLDLMLVKPCFVKNGKSIVTEL